MIAVDATGADLDFGQLLAGWMRARGVSQRHLALMAGVNHSSISRILRGRPPSLALAHRLALALDVQLVIGR